MADASDTTGAWETATVSTPSRCSWLARRPLSFDRERPEESGEGDRMTASSHGDLPDEQGIANAPAKTSSDLKIATGPDKSGSGPKTVTDLAETPSKSERDATDSSQKTATARWRTANETSPATGALNCLTASGKRSKSEIDETGTGAGRLRAGSTILPCSSIRRSGSTGADL